MALILLNNNVKYINLNQNNDYLSNYASGHFQSKIWISDIIYVLVGLRAEPSRDWVSMRLNHQQEFAKLTIFGIVMTKPYK